MAFDFKKEFKEFYLPAATPTIVTVPAMNFLAVRGKGDPNEEGGAYPGSGATLWHCIHLEDAHTLSNYLKIIVQQTDNRFIRQ